MNRKTYNELQLELRPIILNVLMENTESKFLSKKITESAIDIFSRVFEKLFNSRLRESKELQTKFNKESTIELLVLPTINRTITYIKESLLKEELLVNQIDRTIEDLNLKLKGQEKLNLTKILLDKKIDRKEVLPESLKSNNYIYERHGKEDIVQRINSLKNMELKERFASQESKKFLNNIFKLNDSKLIDKLFSNSSQLLESILNISFSIDCDKENPLEIVSKSLGLLKMIADNPRVINSIKKKPKLIRLFKDKKYDSIASNNAKKLSDIFIKIPNRILRSNPGQLNISNDEYSRLNDKTKSYIDDYRTIMSDYYPENLVDVFESKVYSAIYEGLKEDNLEEDLKIELIEHFSNYYLDVFNKRKNLNLYENKMNSELSKYFISNSSVMNAHRYALKELNKYILSEGLMDSLKKSLFGGKISSGTVGKIKNWFKDTTVMKYMKKISNTMDTDIQNWESKLNPSQKKLFNDYPHLKAVFARGGLDTNLAVNLIKNHSLLKALNRCPKLAVIIANNTKVADLLLKRDKRLLPKILQNPEMFDWLESSSLSGKILNGNSGYLPVLQACILNFDLATKIVNDEHIISEVGLNNIVDLAELMNSSSELAELLNQLDPEEFKKLSGLLFKEPRVLDFLQETKQGKELVKLAKMDSNDIIVNAIIDNPDKFKEGSDITKIEGNIEYNKLLNKHLAKFRNLSGDNKDIFKEEKTPEAKYCSIYNEFNRDKKEAKIAEFTKDCRIINVTKSNDDSCTVSEDRDGGFWGYKNGTKLKLFINLDLENNLENNDFFETRGSGNILVSIKPAILLKKRDSYSLLKKGIVRLGRTLR